MIAPDFQLKFCHDYIFPIPEFTFQKEYNFLQFDSVIIVGIYNKNPIKGGWTNDNVLEVSDCKVESKGALGFKFVDGACANFGKGVDEKVHMCFSKGLSN